jgi:hypothetical protein
MSESFNLDQKPYLSRCSDSISHYPAHFVHVLGGNALTDFKSEYISRTATQLLEHEMLSPDVVHFECCTSESASTIVL